MRKAASSLVLVWSLAAATDATAARLRPFSEVDGPVVHLSDLFSGLEPGQDCDLGSGPSPGGRVVIGQPQLQAIADEFGVSWEPPPGWQSVTLSRPGKPVDDAVVASLLREALGPLGLDAASVLKLARWATITVDTASRLSVVSPSFDPVTGRFSAELLVSGRDQDTGSFPVEGAAVKLVRVLVPVRNLLPGEVVGATDLDAVTRPQNEVGDDAVGDVDDAVGLVATRPLVRGEVVRRASLRPPKLVTRGAVVLLRLGANGVDLAEEGQAIDGGARGERVRVLNPASQMLLVGTVTGPNEITVDAGAVPLPVADGGSLGLPPLPSRRDLGWNGRSSALAAPGDFR